MEPQFKEAFGYAILGAINVVIFMTIYYAARFTWRGIKALFRRTSHDG